MVQRVARLLLSALIFPLLTGIGLSPCTAMAGTGPTSAAATPAAGATMPGHAGHAAADPAGGPLHQQSGGPCDNSTGTNCCPAAPGCVAIALPSATSRQALAAASVTSVAGAYEELPIAWAVAPEPPPPKA